MPSSESFHMPEAFLAAVLVLRAGGFLLGGFGVEWSVYDLTRKRKL